MSPEAELAELVDDLLGRGDVLDPFIGIVATGISDIGDACVEAQSRSGNWGGMLAKLRSGAGGIEAALERLRGEPGLERFVRFAERQRALAATMIDAIGRLQGDASTLVR